MKIEQGKYGYINYNKKKTAIKAGIEIAIIIALVAIGYIITKSKLNYFTVAAVVFALPTGRAIVNLVMAFPHKSMPKEVYDKVAALEDDNIRIIYDLVITSYDKVMEINSLAIKGNTICAYTKDDKLDINKASKYIKDILANNGCNASIKIYKDFEGYLARIKEIKNNLDSEEKSTKAIEREKQREEKTIATICAISL